MKTKYPSLAYADGTNPWVNFLILITDYVKHSQMLLTKFNVIDLHIFLLNFIFFIIRVSLYSNLDKEFGRKGGEKTGNKGTRER